MTGRKMNLKMLIAIDLDGTLLNKHNEISRENIQAIKEAQKNGIEIVVATGRAHFDVQEIFKHTGIKTWIIGANGATIHKPNGQLFLSTPLDKDKAIEILQWLEQEKYYYEVFSDSAIFTPQNGRELLTIEMDRLISANPELNIEELKYAALKQYSQSGFVFISSYKELLETSINIYNILVFSFDKEKLNKGWKRFKDCNDLTLVTSANYNFELEHIDASKGNALKTLAKELGIPLSQTIAIGDSMNDYSMISIAGKGIAMGNACEEIKNIANEVTLTNDEHGVAYVINRLLKK